MIPNNINPVYLVKYQLDEMAYNLCILILMRFYCFIPTVGQHRVTER